MSLCLLCSQAEGALEELQYMLQRLQDSRDEITKTETEKNLVKRELDLVRHGVQENTAMNEIEHQNLTTTRNR